MSRSTKQAWLEGPGDLQEADVEDVPVKGQSVKVRGLPAAHSLDVVTEATENKIGPRGDQNIRVNRARLEILQFHHGCVEPEFSIEEAEQVAYKFGPAFRKVIDKIDELSALDKEAIDEANARFQGSGEAPSGAAVGNGTPVGDSGPDVPARAGARVGDASG